MRTARRIVSGVLVLALVAGGWFAFANRQWIADYLSVQLFTVSEPIAQLASRSGMSEKGEFYFYASHPRVVDADEFNTACERRERTSPILGCYVSSTNRIFVYDVQNAELDGIKEVTAAHEMLHVAYARLSQGDTDWLEPRLEAAYQRLRTDKLDQRMSYYASAQPGSRLNELHSILPTEFYDLGPELEEYYARYFVNRRAVVDFHEQYSHVFYQLEDESQALAGRLEDDLANINADSVSYAAEVTALNQAIVTFNTRASSGYFSSQSEFTQARLQLVARSSQLVAERNALDARIDEYNTNVERLNALGAKIDRLNKSIDSFEGIQ